MARIMTCVLLLLVLSSTSCGSEVHWENLPQVKSAAFNGADRAWLVTIKGDLLHTKDGGESWEMITGKTVDGFGSVSFIDMKRGWAINKKGQVWRTADSGATWIAIAKLEAKNSNDWRFNSSEQVQFVDESHGWVIETFSIWRTTDGGMNWEKCFSRLDQKVKGQPVRASFVNAELGWVCGTNGEIYRTKDGGKTWQTQRLAAKDSDFTDVFFLDERTGWLTGYVGGQCRTTLYRTNDGGVSWQPGPLIDNNSLINSTYYISEKEGWSVGRACSTVANNKSERGIALHTTDGGQNWQLVQIKGNDPFFDRIYFTDAQHGWLFARDNVYRTDDGGKTWRIVLKLPPIEFSK